MLDSHLEQVFSFAVMEVRRRRHEYFTLEHLLFGIIAEESGQTILNAVGVNIASLRHKLERFFSENIAPALPNSEIEIVQTIALQRVMQRTLRHMHSSGKPRVGVGDVLASLLEEENSYAAFFILSQGITRLDILEYVSSKEEKKRTQYETPEEGGQDTSISPDSKALQKYTVELTEKASHGEIDPLIGRNVELERAVQILARRRKNNPLFVGDPGVGKTALAEGLALRIAQKEVPEEFYGVRLFSLDLGGMMAGAKYRGDFEGRIKSVLAALARIPKAILFVDEIHTLVGAGAVSGGSLDASNILKPALGSGKLRCIGSTTHEEMRNHFEKDRALSRRFQKIDVGEPSHDECLNILKGIKERYETHHNVRYTPAALDAAITLSARYLPDARLPDKAIDLIDEAGARCRLRHQPLDVAPSSHAAEKPQAGASRNTKESQRHVSVGVADVEQVVQSMARIPAVRATASDKISLKHLERDLKRIVFGQPEAIDLVTRAVLRSRAGFKRAGRPQGAFLFYGPTGVGKTELARQLAATMHVAFLRYDMSEYMEKHAIARLIGAPPGYVGFDQGGILIEDIKKNPHAVLLLDEMEKAHPDIFNILLQVMDYATLTDASGRKADFRNIIIIMTTNAGAFEMSARNIGFASPASTGIAADKAKKTLERLFTPEFRNRLDAMIPFKALSPDVMTRIVDKFIAELSTGLAERNVRIELSDTAKKYLSRAGHDKVFGARPLARIIQEQIEDRLAGELLFGRLAKGGEVFIDSLPAATQDDSRQIASPGSKKTIVSPGSDEKEKSTLVFHFASIPAKLTKQKKAEKKATKTKNIPQK
jgi:ATP-dependent Clp protease ATP-binding subunit ClpA